MIIKAGNKDGPRKERKFAIDIIKMLNDNKINKINDLPGNKSM